MLLSYFWNATEQSRLFRRARGPRGTRRWPDSEAHWTNQDQQHLSLVVRSFGGGAWEKKQRLLGCDQTVLHRRVDHSGPLTATSTSYGIKADFSLASSLAVLNSVLLGGLFFFFLLPSKSYKASTGDRPKCLSQPDPYCPAPTQTEIALCH